VTLFLGFPFEIEMNERHSETAPVRPSKDGTGALVLVVDDEEGVRESLRFLLDRHFRVRTVSSGESALRALREEPVDVVLLDLTMPGLGGVETLAKIREVDDAVEVVIVTGYGSYQTAVDALRLRAFDYITKPVNSERVLSIVRRAEQSRRHRHESSSEDGFESLARQASELLDAISSELGDGFFAKLDSVRSLALALHQRIAGRTSVLAQNLAESVGELQRLLPREGGFSTRRALDRIHELLRPLSQ
jgi:FixJ family two-component response regulator